MKFFSSHWNAYFALLILSSVSAGIGLHSANAEPKSQKWKEKRDILFPGCRNPFCKSSHIKSKEGCDPKPPQVLQVASRPVADGGEDLTIDVTVLPNPYATVELVAPNSARLSRMGGNVGMKPAALARGASETQNLKLYYNDSGQSEELIFRAILRNDNGEVFAEVTEVVKINPASVAEGAMEERVPVVFEYDGKKIVQYMPRSEALERGLPPVAKAPATPQSATTEEAE